MRTPHLFAPPPPATPLRQATFPPPGQRSIAYPPPRFHRCAVSASHVPHDHTFPSRHESTPIAPVTRSPSHRFTVKFDADDRDAPPPPPTAAATRPPSDSDTGTFSPPLPPPIPNPSPHPPFPVPLPPPPPLPPLSYVRPLSRAFSLHKQLRNIQSPSLPPPFASQSYTSTPVYFRRNPGWTRSPLHVPTLHPVTRLRTPSAPPHLPLPPPVFLLPTMVYEYTTPRCAPLLTLRNPQSFPALSPVLTLTLSQPLYRPAPPHRPPPPIPPPLAYQALFPPPPPRQTPPTTAHPSTPTVPPKTTAPPRLPQPPRPPARSTPPYDPHYTYELRAMTIYILLIPRLLARPSLHPRLATSRFAHILLKRSLTSPRTTTPTSYAILPPSSPYHPLVDLSPYPHESTFARERDPLCSPAHAYGTNSFQSAS